MEGGIATGASVTVEETCWKIVGGEISAQGHSARRESLTMMKDKCRGIVETETY